MISIPRKATDDVDWTTPIRNLISQSYGEDPDNYSAECAALQRCRQDAVKGAGSDMTGMPIFASAARNVFDCWLYSLVLGSPRSAI
jgi:hypothetical protein